MIFDGLATSQEPHFFERAGRGGVGKPLHARAQRVNIGDQVIAERHRMAQRRQQGVNNSRHVVQAAAPHKADPVVVKAAQSHQFILCSRRGIQPIRAMRTPFDNST
jgi:hypothetical protein